MRASPPEGSSNKPSDTPSNKEHATDWSEPIASSYGLHLVWIHEVRTAEQAHNDPGTTEPEPATGYSLGDRRVASTPVPEREAKDAGALLQAALRELRRDVIVTRVSLKPAAN